MGDSKKRTKKASLISKSHTGGLSTNSGVDYQRRFVVSKLPEWLFYSQQFDSLIPEGTGDVDVNFVGPSPNINHYQAKNHQVTLTVFKNEILKGFIIANDAAPGAILKFVLVCESLDAKLITVRNALERYRNVGGFYSEDSMAPTLMELRQTLVEAGLSDFVDFIIDNVEFEVGNALLNPTLQKELFSSRLSNIVTNSAGLDHVYTKMLDYIAEQTGKKITKNELLEIFRKCATEIINPPSVVLAVHCYVKDQAGRIPHYEFDWTAHFIKESRILPTEEVWSSELLPAIAEVREEISNATTRRLEVIGKMPLSMGFSIGHIFSRVRGYNVEFAQTSNSTNWCSNAFPEATFIINCDTEVGVEDADSIAIILNITGDISLDVKRFIDDSGLKVKETVSISPASGHSSLSIKNDKEAIQLCLLIKNMIKSICSKHHVHRTHLFLCCPQSVSLFLGHYCSNLGQIHLYEFYENKYVQVLTIPT